MLRTYSASLEVLEIDLLDWWDAQWNWCANKNDLQLWIKDHNFFRGSVLELPSGSTDLLFPSLKSLSLSNLHFDDASLEMAHAFNISRLHHLSLRNCPNTGSLLRKVVESGEPIKLRSLELVVRLNRVGSPMGEMKEEDQIASFLSSFQGLSSLRILVLHGNYVETPYRYWPSIFHHKTTLTKLVYHERVYGYNFMDSNIELENDEVLELLTQMNLGCIGLCLSPKPPTVRHSIDSCNPSFTGKSESEN